jgi:hypothetical protein
MFFYKPNKINIASINYLYEVSAIPENIREEYLQKLLKRKNSENQKNVRLIKAIYKYINEDKISRWDPEYVCKMLEINNNAASRNRAFKRLRQYYFKWKKFQELEKTLNNSDSLLRIYNCKKMRNRNA